MNELCRECYIACLAVRLYREPKTDAVDAHGRLLRYGFRVRDGLNVNVQLCASGRLRRTSTTVGADVTRVSWCDLASGHVGAMSASGAAALERRGTRTYGVSRGPP